MLRCMDKFYDYITNKLLINSARAAEEYYDTMEEYAKKEEEFKRKPIEQKMKEKLKEQQCCYLVKTHKSIF